mgnify:CR=1 FL=1
MMEFGLELRDKRGKMELKSIIMKIRKGLVGFYWTACRADVDL